MITVKRTRSERISLKREQIIQLQNELKRLENQDREAERKARTKRLCKRAGFLESVLPDTVILTDERFERFVKLHIANQYGIRAINSLKSEQEKEAVSTKPAISTQARVIEAEDDAGDY